MKLKTILLALLLTASARINSQIPILNSYPAITNKVIYLDFNGQVVSGTLWNNGNTINAAASGASSANIKIIWQRMSEDYRPFDVNITTDSTRFNSAPQSSRIRVVFTPTSAWFGSAGGVAYLGSFTWGGYPGTPCWVFENQLGYNPKSMAEAASHEVGHTLSLMHQSVYNVTTCSKTAEYNPGQGTGVTSWAPIMGVGYSKNVTIWHNGTNATSCTTYQFDHGTNNPGITGPTFLNFLPDDVGNTFNTGKLLNLTNLTTADSGLITTPTDLDVYRFTICNNRYVSFNIKPWALDTTSGSYSGANLDVKFKLYNSSNTLIAGDSAISKLNTLVGLNLTAGSYYFTVDGDASANYSDYGTIGKYYMSIKATNPPQLANTIVTPTSMCAGQNAVLSYSSNGTPTNWVWTITGPTSFTSGGANPLLNFSAAGIYTISLLATSSNSTSCVTTKTLDIGTTPVLTVLGTNTVLCPQKTGSISATGATSYTWLPGNFGGSSQLVVPTVNTTYTVIGSNGTCINSAVGTITVSPGFNVNVAVSATSICPGESTTITASGAQSYVINPGNITSNPAVVSPTFNTNYTVTANNLGCLKTAYKLIKVFPAFTVSAFSSDTIICASQPITITATGGVNYTINPGGIIANPATVSPTAATIFTITGQDANQCEADSTLEIIVTNCNYAGISTQLTDAGFKLYPNPATSGFKIEGIGKAFKLTMYDALGKEVYSKNSESNNTLNIKVEDWPRGVYYLKIDAEDKTIKGGKIIIR